MKINELPKSYEPKLSEQKWYKYWNDNGFFRAPKTTKSKTYSIVIPPPNITGILHMGHALNNTIQDVLIRWHRMNGDATLWQPGTDHAGIATQNVVEKKILKEEKKNRYQIGREELIKRIWKWRDEYGDTILDQLKALGASLDWSRTRFTLDEGLSRAVNEAFVHLYNKGLIYKGKYIVNWCPRCHTALSDDEVEHRDTKGKLWHIKYPIKGSEQSYIIVATTRPETMLGDTAVAVNPSDERYANLIGELLILPETDREIPVVADHFVDKEFGTGAVKVTPAHDPNDFQIGQRHNLPSIDVMTDDGKMNENAGEKYKGLTREECRKKIVEELEKQNFLEKIEDHANSIGECYRCKTIIEPRLSDQWFVKLKPLAEKAIKATEEGKVKFYPERWTKFYLSWLADARDWCISRQIWWGHRIPVWYCENYTKQTDQKSPAINDEKCLPIVSITPPTKCPRCNSTNLKQEDDVLDTWFSSSLWPFSTLGWPEKTDELETYYPTNTLVTDRGIIFFWVARMVMMGLELMKEIPFHDVYIHGTILDEQGRKMSKSVGNGIDPIKMIDKYGADATRFSLMVLSVEGQDLKLSESKFDMGKHFCNKLWNACRFALMNCQESPVKPNDKDLSLADKWIINRTDTAIKIVNMALSEYKFSEAAQTLYQFVWNELCDWYLEAVKPALNNKLEDKQANTSKYTLINTLEVCLKLLHPFMPFITEEIWQIWPVKKTAKSLIVASYPKTSDVNFETDAVKFARIQNIVSAIRNIRGEHNVKPNEKIKVSIALSDKMKKEISIEESYIKDLAGLKHVEYLSEGSEFKKAAVAPLDEGITVFVPYEGIIDMTAETERLNKEKNRLENDIENTKKRLSDESFISKAPADIVQKQKDRLIDSERKIKEIERSLENLK